MNMKITALILFILTYILLFLFPSKKSLIALSSAAIFILTGIIPVREISSMINWNVILMIAGTMGIVSLFIESKMPALAGDYIVKKTSNLKWVIILLAVVAGFISAFVDNVATVLIIVPIAINLLKRLKMPLIPICIIAISLSANLQGAATMVGDTTSMLLAGQTDMNFADFFVYQGKPGLFFIVQISSAIAILVLLLMLKKYSRPIEAPADKVVVTDHFPTILLISLVVSLIIASFIPEANKPDMLNGIVCIVLLAIGLLHEMLTKHGLQDIKDNLIEIDLQTLLLLTGLFIVVGGIVKAGLIEDISNFFLKAGGSSHFLIYSLIVWFSVIISAFIDNIPYVAAMLPVAAFLTQELGMDTPLLYFGLLSGATLGGNLTPFGASANITTLGLLKKEGSVISSKEFMKTSIPFTLAAVVTGYLLIWFLWS